MIAAALVPLWAGAAELSDTTFTVNGKDIVVDVDGDKTNVKVYNKSGVEETKVSEMNFVDGQEYEKVFVGSPFIPSSSLQHLDYAPRFATVWFGASNITRSVMGTSQINHARTSNSFELGITPYYMSVPFNKSQSIGLSLAAQLVWNHLCFQKDQIVGETDGKWSFSPMERRAEGNNINYLAYRLPVMFTWQTGYEFNIGVGLSPELRTDAWYRMKRLEGNVKDTYGLKRFGLNLMIGWGVGPLVCSGSFGLTPIFKTADGRKAYQNSFSVGIDALSLVKIIRYDKDRKKTVRGKALLDN